MKVIIGRLIKNIFLFVGLGCFGIGLLIMLFTAKGNSIFPALIENLSAGISVLVFIILGAINLILASFIHTK